MPPVPNITGMQPNLFRIFRAAIDAPCEYAFPTRKEATRARYQLYTARRKFSRTGHPLVPAFEVVSITMPQERPRADGSGTEWYWRIGESLIFEKMQAQLEAHCAAHGIDPSSYDPPSPPSFEPEPSIPLAPDAVRDGDTPPALAPTYAPIDPTRLRASGTARESATDAVTAMVGIHRATPDAAKTAAELIRESIARAKAQRDRESDSDPSTSQ